MLFCLKHCDVLSETLGCFGENIMMINQFPDLKIGAIEKFFRNNLDAGLKNIAPGFYPGGREIPPPQKIRL